VFIHKIEAEYLGLVINIEVCWQKEKDGHLPSIKSIDDDDLQRGMEDLMMMHKKMLKT